MKNRIKLSILVISALMITACGGDENYTPKPRGYFRIATPVQSYQHLETECPYTFEYNEAARWEANRRECWGDVYYPSIKARLQLTYKEVTSTNLDTLLGEGHELAFKHVVKADGITEKLYTDPEREVYGVLYKMRGEAASSTQFFMTDSTQHFLRGVLYFYAEPNEDSLQPVNDFMYEEVAHLIETLKWENSLP